MSLVRLVSLPRSTGPLQTPRATLCPSLMMYVAVDAQEIIRSELLVPWGKGAAKSSDAGQVCTHHAFLAHQGLSSRLQLFYALP